MPNYSDTEKLEIFKWLFKGREDVFAIRWEKSKKSGYMPAYHFDPHIFRLFRIKGGKLKDFKDKKLAPLTDAELLNHLHGRKMIGIYPLLENNTSWFIAADFDKKNWESESRKLINACKEKGIPAYLERSRSGEGGHVWIFFEQPYLAAKSRKILSTLMEQAGLVSVFDKSSSFDRMFPNQDMHSGKGMGNLIALPLNKLIVEQGNCCFVDDNLQPFPDQWKFLLSIQKVTQSQLDTIYSSLSPGNPSIGSEPIASHNDTKLKIRLSNVIQIQKSTLNIDLTNFLKKELNISNSDFYARKKTGRSTWGVEQYFNLIEESDSMVSLPRGFIGKLIRFCYQHKIDHEFLDKRSKLDPIHLAANFSLRSHQQTVLDVVFRKDFGVIAAPPGSGKTIIGLQIIADKKQPALIIVHRRQIMAQWIERIQAFLGIPKHEIGRIGQGKSKTGKLVTVAMIQSLYKHLEKQDTDDFTQSFGTIIIDECHHIPAKSYRNTISRFSSYYQYGLTATPFRKGSDGKLIFLYLGDIIVDIKEQEIEEFKKARVIIRDTDLDVPFNSKTDPFEHLSRILIHDSNRNKLILEDINHELNKGRRAVIITERKAHIDTLFQFLKQSFEVVTLSGDDTNKTRELKWKNLRSGDYQVLITTGQLFGEGTDLQNVSCLFLVYPFTFKGKLIQYIGRVQRSGITPIIYDYRDRKIDYLNRLFLKRNKYYRDFDRQATLFEDPNPDEVTSTNPQMIEKRIKIPFDELDFRYGAVGFLYRVSQNDQELEFEIENDNLRPEFDVLKPFFARVLKSRQIEVQIFVEYENGELVSQNATSQQVDQINREIIDSVKFQFLEKRILRKKYDTDTGGLLDVNEVQEGNESSLIYKSGEEVLDKLLQDEKVRHYRQLRYLATQHDASTLKIRFVLYPFSFVFLVSGAIRYHVIMETLDTEEATYMWHVEKDIASLKDKLQSIDEDLKVIRNKGRQAFLETEPQNFSRIIHDYSEDRRGFIVWKDQLEERLI